MTNTARLLFKPSRRKLCNGHKTPHRAWVRGTRLRPGIGVPIDGSLITLYDENDRAIQAQVRDAQGTIVSRVVRSFDANGRLAEEKPIFKNPILAMLDKMPDDERAQIGSEQFNQLNEQMSYILGGKNQACTTFLYDDKNRVTRTHERNVAFERITMFVYNDHGDKTEERTTVIGNSSMPVGLTHSIDENGPLVAGGSAEIPAPNLVTEDQEIHYTYKYDAKDNWIEQIANHGQDKTINVQRTLSYH